VDDVRIIDATETHLAGITAIFNHAVRETFSIWSETEHSVYVAPSAQRRGIGRIILNHLIQRARELGMQTMVGGVDSANVASIALHQQAGFELQGMLKGVGQKFGKKLDLAFLVKAL
jgi:L-amino acid N-acyltransferase YncA